MIVSLEPIADDLGLRPWEFRRLTLAELDRLMRAETRRQARRADEQAWMVAHLMVAGGHMPRGTRVSGLIRELLGRQPGTVPGQPEVARARAELSPEMSVAYMATWVRAFGGQDRRAEKM